uniref:Glucosyl/glucuronosyl transferases n=2 Tax=Daphnia magna TaxID=35525 RepID=A0A0P6HAK6_9CRUS
MKLKLAPGVLWLIAGLAIEVASAANILFLSPFTSYSHTHVFFYSIKALASRGHTITHWNGLLPREDLANVTHLHSASLHKMNSRHEIGFNSNNPIALMLTLPDRLSTICKAVYREPVFHQLIASQEHFDLIVIETFMNDCMLPLVQHFHAPFIYLSALPPLPWMLDYTCSPLSFQQFPALCTTFTEEMNFPQRVVNVFLNLMVIYYRDWFILPRVDQIAAEAWINSTVALSPVKEIERNMSFLITNSHPVINYQYFKSGLIVEVGGLHLVPPKELPQEVENFVDGSGDAGFIVLSFGSILRGASMPEATRKIFLAAFSRLPFRVLWKWEDELGMKDLPANVKLSTWLPPLQDLLAHPKMRLLMTHGGLYSNQETVWSGVPLIGFPVFGDQVNYVVKAERDGYAICLDWKTLTEDILYNAIQEIVTNPKYKQNAMKLSYLMRDQIELGRPLERAVHAIEYVIRHRGAAHLRPAACRLSPIQRESMDVTFIYTAFFVALIYLIICLSRFTFRKFTSVVKVDRLKKRQ